MISGGFLSAITFQHFHSRKRHEHVIAIDKCKAVGPPCRHRRGICQGAWAPISGGVNRTPSRGRSLLTGAPTCPGGPGSPGGPWNPCGRVCTRKVWVGEGEAGGEDTGEGDTGVEATPRDPCFSPAWRSRSPHDSHPSLLNFKERLARGQCLRAAMTPVQQVPFPRVLRGLPTIWPGSEPSF